MESTGNLDAVDAATGERLWRYQWPSAGGQLSFHVSDGVAYITSGTSNYAVDNIDAVYAVEMATGSFVWKYPIGFNGRVYDLAVESSDGMVYAGLPEGAGSQLSNKVFLYAIQK